MPSEETKKGGLDLSGESAGSFQTGKNYLLAIGINKYAAHAPLKNAAKDVQDIAALLSSNYGFVAEEPFTRYLLDRQATERAIKKSLRQLCQVVQPDDRALILYSGHGHLDPLTKLGFWIPADAEKNDESTYLPNSVIRDYIKAMPCRHVLLISDSCFSGELLVRDASRRADGAFSDWERRQSRWVFCSGKGAVSDGKAGENSPFATQILRFLHEQSPGEPLDISLLANRVTKTVRFNYEQQAEACPLYGAGHDGGQFIFYPQKSKDTVFEKAKVSEPPVIGISREKLRRQILLEIQEEERRSLDPFHDLMVFIEGGSFYMGTKTARTQMRYPFMRSKCMIFSFANTL